jgi:hypothetical protein
MKCSTLLSYNEQLRLRMPLSDHGNQR